MGLAPLTRAELGDVLLDKVAGMLGDVVRPAATQAGAGCAALQSVACARSSQAGLPGYSGIGSASPEPLPEVESRAAP